MEVGGKKTFRKNREKSSLTNCCERRNRDFKFQFLRIIIAFCNSERFSSLCHREMCARISLQIFFREFLGVFLYAFLRIF